MPGSRGNTPVVPSSSSPIEFRLNLDNRPPNMQTGLVLPCHASTNVHEEYDHVNGGKSTHNLIGSLRLVREIMLVLTLALIMLTLLFGLTHLNSTVNYYYEAASPYLSELSNHSMGIMRHADESASSLEDVMTQAQVLAGTAIPELMESVNRTASMVSRMQQLAQNPTIRLSMGS